MGAAIIVNDLQIEWDEDKNRHLLASRGITFEVVEEILTEGAYDIREHPNQERYPGQVLLIFEFEEYTWVCAAEPRGDRLTLKTIFPSRKYHRERRRND